MQKSKSRECVNKNFIAILVLAPVLLLLHLESPGYTARRGAVIKRNNPITFGKFLIFRLF
jgi:hypothetical protein